MRTGQASRYREGMTTAAAVLVVIVALGGALVWIGLLLWGARGDGRDQRAYDEALRTYRRDETERKQRK
jgi:L-aminopeptidase/D-esterase-like protein